MTTPELSVVIPVLNAESTIATQLRALRRSAGDRVIEVIVVDTGSTDETAAVVDREAASWPAICRIEIDRPDVGRARNAGVRAAACERIAMCDGDDVVVPTWVPAMADALRDHGCVTGPMLVDEINPPHVAQSRGLTDPLCVPRFLGAFPYPNGASFGLRREVWDAVGGLVESDGERLLEDIDLGLRLHLARIPVHLAAGAAVHYRYREGTGELWRQGTTYGAGRVGIAAAARRAGIEVPRLAGWRSWVWLVVHLPDGLMRRRRPGWVWVAANRWGHLRGSLRHRTLCL